MSKCVPLPPLKVRMPYEAGGGLGGGVCDGAASPLGIALMKAKKAQFGISRVNLASSFIRSGNTIS